MTEAEYAVTIRSDGQWWFAQFKGIKWHEGKLEVAGLTGESLGKNITSMIRQHQALTALFGPLL